MVNSRIEIRVQPKSSRNEVIIDARGRVKVYLTTAPEGGKANDAAVELIADRLGLAKSAVGIVRGQTTRNKLISIQGIDAETVMARIKSKSGAT